MKIWQETLPYTSDNPIADSFFTPDALFFDIETTGFSPSYSTVYLIGCCSRQNDSLIIEQFFAETPKEEATVIDAFCKRLEQFGTVITFNGIGFDIPFLTARCKTLHLPEHFCDFEYLDLYKAASKLKFALQLPNFKQKSIECFLGIDREDRFNGGELIEVYKSYVRRPEYEALYLLKQHNYDDVLGMPALLSILSYTRFFESDCVVTEIDAAESPSMDGTTVSKELIFTLSSEVSLPKRISCRFEEFYLTAEGNTSKLSVRLYDGELKFFLDNPKDYYYLPEEDTAYPKSIASGVDKAHKKQATKATCFTKKSGIFLPQYESIVTPEFRIHSPKEKKSYFELSEAFLHSDEVLTAYVRHIFRQFSKKPPRA